MTTLHTGIAVVDRFAEEVNSASNECHDTASLEVIRATAIKSLRSEGQVSSRSVVAAKQVVDYFEKSAEKNSAAAQVAAEFEQDVEKLNDWQGKVLNVIIGLNTGDYMGHTLQPPSLWSPTAQAQMGGGSEIAFKNYFMQVVPPASPPKTESDKALTQVLKLSEPARLGQAERALAAPTRLSWFFGINNTPEKYAAKRAAALPASQALQNAVEHYLALRAAGK